MKAWYKEEEAQLLQVVKSCRDTTWATLALQEVRSLNFLQYQWVAQWPCSLPSWVFGPNVDLPDLTSNTQAESESSCSDTDEDESNQLKVATQQDCQRDPTVLPIDKL